jgi:hypothetical protein
VFRSVREHTKIAGICPKPGQFPQPCRPAGGPHGSASRPFSGRRKKTFEFTLQRLKTGKNLTEIAHLKITYCVATYIVRCSMARLWDRVKNRQIISTSISALLNRHHLKQYAIG